MGNTLGGAVSWWMGLAPARPWCARAAPPKCALGWLRRFGPAACLLSWLPGVGDPLCAVAGWLKLPFWPLRGLHGSGQVLSLPGHDGVLLYFMPGQLGG